MPTYLDFIFTFGAQIEARDVKFSGFYEQTLLGEYSGGIAAPELGRSGRQFQLCYNLAGVSDTKNDRPDIKLPQWSIRQAAIHHQFDVVYGTTLWIVTKGRDDIKRAYKELTGAKGRQQDKAYKTVEQCLRSSFAAHLLFCYWATHDWRWYITWIETEFDRKVNNSPFCEEILIGIQRQRLQRSALEFLVLPARNMRQMTYRSFRSGSRKLMKP
jgi:hypothetical protein